MPVTVIFYTLRSLYASWIALMTVAHPPQNMLTSTNRYTIPTLHPERFLVRFIFISDISTPRPPLSYLNKKHDNSNTWPCFLFNYRPTYGNFTTFTLEPLTQFHECRIKSFFSLFRNKKKEDGTCKIFYFPHFYFH